MHLQLGESTRNTVLNVFFPSEVAVHFILSTVCPQHSTFSLSLSLNTPHLPLGREEGHKRGTRGEILETGGAASLSSSWMDERMDAQFSFGLSSFIFGRNPYFTTFSLHCSRLQQADAAVPRCGDFQSLLAPYGSFPTLLLMDGRHSPRGGFPLPVKFAKCVRKSVCPAVTGGSTRRAV